VNRVYLRYIFCRLCAAVDHLLTNPSIICRHPNICSLRQNFDDGNSFYIVFDLVSGGEVFEELCCHGPYSEADAARHLREATAGLAFMHGLGIVHADVKPENLMLSSPDPENAIIKLVDLGCAHLTKNAPWMDHQQKGTANTPSYCAPEVLREMKMNKKRHAEISPSFDMWSLGVVLYVMLVGKLRIGGVCSTTFWEGTLQPTHLVFSLSSLQVRILST